MKNDGTWIAHSSSVIGNNALLATALGLERIGSCMPYEGIDMATVAAGPEGGRSDLSARLRKLFPTTYQAIEYGSQNPKRIAILTGSVAGLRIARGR